MVKGAKSNCGYSIMKRCSPLRVTRKCSASERFDGLSHGLSYENHRNKSGIKTAESNTCKPSAMPPYAPASA